MPPLLLLISHSSTPCSYHYPMSSFHHCTLCTYFPITWKNTQVSGVPNNSPLPSTHGLLTSSQQFRTSVLSPLTRRLQSPQFPSKISVHLLNVKTNSLSSTYPAGTDSIKCLSCEDSSSTLCHEALPSCLGCHHTHHPTLDGPHLPHLSPQKPTT